MADFDKTFSEVSQLASDLVEKYFRPFDGIETVATHGGFDSDAVADVGRPVVTPIVLATTFRQLSPGVAKYDYIRGGNYSRECLEKCIAALEGGDHCSVYSSGLACLLAIVQKLCAGDHIVASDDLYGGHSDVLMGAVITKNRPELRQHFTYTQMAVGAVPSPFDCYLCLRGIRTLPVRMQTHMRNALIVAMMLERHPKVEKVIHPALKSHPQHELALKQMRGFSGMVTVYLRCNEAQTMDFVKNIKIFMLAESLGGYESLIEIPSIMTHASVPPEIRAKNGITDSMLRLSVGLESAKDLVKALYDGLDKLD
ncbi:unnamed protein product [Calicophoron daubneyi]|uniref:cystathionine gamma-lyase n=1 Tax=Calicophoron daubneyi TaxID=300641 RepID=A0AAV2T8U2_CALDB